MTSSNGLKSVVSPETTKQLRYCIQRRRDENALIVGGAFKSLKEAKEALKKWHKIDRLKDCFIVERMVYIPRTLTKEEQLDLEIASKILNRIIGGSNSSHG